MGQLLSFMGIKLFHVDQQGLDDWIMQRSKWTGVEYSFSCVELGFSVYIPDRGLSHSCHLETGLVPDVYWRMSCAWSQKYCGITHFLSSEKELDHLNPAPFTQLGVRNQPLTMTWDLLSQAFWDNVVCCRNCIANLCCGCTVPNKLFLCVRRSFGTASLCCSSAQKLLTYLQFLPGLHFIESLILYSCFIYMLSILIPFLRCSSFWFLTVLYTSQCGLYPFFFFFSFFLGYYLLSEVVLLGTHSCQACPCFCQDRNP